jgi:hypothetical protein
MHRPHHADQGESPLNETRGRRSAIREDCGSLLAVIPSRRSVTIVGEQFDDAASFTEGEMVGNVA